MMEEQDYRRISSSNNTDYVGVDRISDLPDCILGHILSFLYPTTAAVATSLLSKRWKFLWLDVHNLGFYFSPVIEQEDSAENKAFIQLVDRVLLLTDGRPLNNFSLNWFCAIPSRLVCWIDAALSRNVHEINLELARGSLRSRSLRLPICSFNCDSLRSLSLELLSTTIVCDTAEVCLPRLETLIVKSGCRFTSKEAFEKLIDGCPQLRHLKLSIYSSKIANEEEDTMYKVSSPSLTYLDMYFGHRCTLKLIAPSLEYLKLKGHMLEIFVEKSLSSLVTAVLYSEEDSSCFLQDFVHKSENLEELKIGQADWRHLNWRSTSDVPRCLSKTLKKVRLFGYSGLEHKRETIRFMLEHGIALEVVEIGYENTKDGEKLLKEICEFPRKSLACKVSPYSRFKFRSLAT